MTLNRITPIIWLLPASIMYCLQPSELKLKEEFLPPGWLCLVLLQPLCYVSLSHLKCSFIVLVHYLVMSFLIQVCGASETAELPPNFVKLAKDAYTPDIIAASDCMLGQYEAWIAATCKAGLNEIVILIAVCYFRKNWIWHC